LIRLQQALELMTAKKHWEQADAIPTLVQLLQVEEEPVRLQLVAALSRIEGQEATAALVQRALFDLSADVRAAAIQALSHRPAEQYRRQLLDGLRYPWSTVADHAAEALANLHIDVVPELIDMLDRPDPQAPTLSAEGRLVSRELVKVNHLRNCYLCHAPSQRTNDERLRGLVPTPGQPIPELYYETQRGDFVRADITYLKQDFSVKLDVEHAAPWPTAQRYDFFVRQRELTAEETAAYLAACLSPDAHWLRREESSYPQRQAVLFALRKLTGEDLGTRTEAWRSWLRERRPAVK
jgi:hypothetical protein